MHVCSVFVGAHPIHRPKAPPGIATLRSGQGQCWEQTLHNAATNEENKPELNWPLVARAIAENGDPRRYLRCLGRLE